MKSKYQNYYDKLKNINFSLYTSKYNNAINTIKSKINSASANISSNSSSWSEKGVYTIQNTTIPDLLKSVNTVEKGIGALSQAVGRCNTLVAKLSELDSLCKEQENAKEEEKGQYDSRINSLENAIDGIIADINGITVESVKKNEISYIEKDGTVVTSTIAKMSTQMAERKASFIGSIDDSTQYTRDDNYKSIEKLMTAFDNTTGEILTNNSKITLKPGETRVITVKLPTNTGMIGELKRTTADGDGTYKSGKVVTAISNVNTDSTTADYVNYKSYSKHYPKGVDLHKNSYDWVITAVGEGKTIVNQTCEYTTKDDPNWYAESILNLDIEVKS